MIDHYVVQTVDSYYSVDATQRARIVYALVAGEQIVEFHDLVGDTVLLVLRHLTSITTCTAAGLARTRAWNAERAAEREAETPGWKA